MISKNRICDITKSWRFLGITISFLYITKSIFYTKKKKKSGLFFDISQNRVCDFTVHRGLFQDFINNNL